jgi:hypothetical protein
VAKIGANAHLGRGLGILGDDILALDLAIPGFHIHCGADLAGLRDIEFCGHNNCQAEPTAPLILRAPDAEDVHCDPASPMADCTII